MEGLKARGQKFYKKNVISKECKGERNLEVRRVRPASEEAEPKWKIQRLCTMRLYSISIR